MSKSGHRRDNEGDEADLGSEISHALVRDNE